MEELTKEHHPGLDLHGRDVHRQVLECVEGRDVSLDYEIGETIGNGAFSEVSVCIHRSTHQLRAIKKLRKRGFLTAKDERNLRREIDVMRRLSQHPNVVDLHAVYEDDSNVYLILDLCRGGDMFQRLLKIDHYTESDAASVCREALRALSYIHSKEVVYRDLKPDNFLFESDLPGSALKAADFGLSTFIQPHENLTSVCGTPMYCAPEVVRRSYNTKADVWSLGVTLFIMLSGKVPFWGRSVERTFEKVLRGSFHFEDEAWQHVSDAAKECVSSMLTYDPEHRPSAEKLLKHAWIREDGVAAVTPLLESVYSNVRCFMQMNKLQQRATQIMATNLDLTQVNTVQRIFNAIDKDNSGYITAGEMRTAIESLKLPVSVDQMQELWNIYDVDDDGLINYVEFLTATTQLSKVLTFENMKYAFAQMDVDNDGHLSLEEVKHKLHDLRLPESDIQLMINAADTNHDGTLDYNEFVNMMQSVIERQYERDALRHEDMSAQIDWHSAFEKGLLS